MLTVAQLKKLLEDMPDEAPVAVGLHKNHIFGVVVQEIDLQASLVAQWASEVQLHMEDVLDAGVPTVMLVDACPHYHQHGVAEEHEHDVHGHNPRDN